MTQYGTYTVSTPTDSISIKVADKWHKDVSSVTVTMIVGYADGTTQTFTQTDTWDRDEYYPNPDPDDDMELF